MVGTKKEIFEKPLVSIGIPVFNGGEDILRAVNSLINQSYKNLEIIISDNCSSDETEKYCRAFKDSRISYFRQIENIGSTRNFQFVLERAHGNFFMWLGHDDWLDEDYIKICQEFLIKNPDYSICGGLGKYFKDKEYSYTGVNYTNEINDGTKRLINYHKKLGENGIFYGLIRKDMLKKAGKLKNTLGGDDILLGRLAFQGKFKTISNTNVLRKLGGCSSSTKKTVVALGLSPFYIAFPHFLYSWHLAMDLFVSKAFSSCSVFTKFILFHKIFYFTQKKYLVNRWKISSVKFLKKILGEVLYKKLRGFI